MTCFLWHQRGAKAIFQRMAKMDYRPKVDKRLTVRIDDESLARLELLCQKWRCSSGQAIRRLIDDNAPALKKQRG